MKKRALLGLVILLLAVGCVCFALAESPVHLNCPQIHIGEATVSVLLTGEKREETADWRDEIRYFAFDAESGIYETGEGRVPEDGVAFAGWIEDGYGYTVRIDKPGKYLLSGVPVYVLDMNDEKQNALYTELDAALLKYEKTTQQQTAQGLYAWTIKKVNCKLPADREDLAEICTDPMNCLLTGYIVRDTYAPLLQMVLKQAGIESLKITGTVTQKNETSDWSWLLCRLDGNWLYADMALDDLNNQNGGAQYAKDWKTISKNHALSEESEKLVGDMIDSCFMDVLLRDDRELTKRLQYTSEKQGQYVDQYQIVGPEYSLGPSGPVTIRSIRNYRDAFTVEDSGMTPEMFIRYNVLTGLKDWDDRFHSFAVTYGRAKEIPEDAITILEYEEDMSRVVVQFNQPGMYILNGNAGGFVVLDPENEDFVEVARLLDEARETCVGETETETAKLLENWEAAQLVYNRKVYIDMLNLMEDEENEGAQDPFNALIDKTAVCGGYSNLYRLLLSNAGINAFQITGKTSNKTFLYHAWNLARLDGTWCYIDPTWDDKGNKAGSQWFARDRQYFEKNQHMATEYTIPFLDQMIETPVYTLLINRFDAAYAPPAEIPAELSTLPATAAECRFSTQNANFFKLTQLEYDGRDITYSVNRPIQSGHLLVRDSKGEKNYNFSLGFGYWKWWPYTAHAYLKNNIVSLTFRDYEENNRPINKASIDQTLRFDFGELTEEEYNWNVPMKKNEIRGYSEKSCKTWTWGKDMKPAAMTWSLVNDTRNMEITVYFDEEGNAERYAVATSPAGGDEIRWEVRAADDRVLSLRIEQGEKVYTLTDMTDKWTEPRYKYFRQELKGRYSIIPEEGAPEGVYMYIFGSDYYRPLAGMAFVTEEPLLRWTETGLEINEGVLDINGKTVEIKTDEPVDLAVCRRIKIGK